MSPKILNTGSRAVVFGVLTWWLIRSLFQYWSILVSVAATNGMPVGAPDGMEHLAYSAPPAKPFGEWIALCAACITILGMLCHGRVPGWTWVGVTAIGTAALTSCWVIEGDRVIWKDSIFNGEVAAGGVLSPAQVGMLIIDIELLIIARILWSWWRKAQAASAVTGVASDAPAPSPLRPVLRRAVLTLTVLLSIWASLAAFSSENGASPAAGYPSYRERYLKTISREKSPHAWLDAARRLAWDREVWGRLAEAADLWLEVVELDEARENEDSRVLTTDIGSLAVCLTKGNRPAAAEPWLRRMITRLEKESPDDLRSINTARRNLARTLRDLRKFDESKQLYESVIAAEHREQVESFPPSCDLPRGLEQEYRDLLRTIGESPAAIQKRIDTRSTPPP